MAIVRIRFGECVFDSDTRDLTREGSPVHLSPKAFRLLEVLLERRPKAVSRRALHRLLWPDSFVSDAARNSVVTEARAAIRDDSRAPRLVRTVPVFGYAFSDQATEAGGVKGPRSAPSCRVIVAGQNHDLTEGENVLGRGPDVAVSIDDEPYRDGMRSCASSPAGRQRSKISEARTAPSLMVGSSPSGPFWKTGTSSFSETSPSNSEASAAPRRLEPRDPSSGRGAAADGGRERHTRRRDGPAVVSIAPPKPGRARLYREPPRLDAHVPDVDVRPCRLCARLHSLTGAHRA